jgi:hypothetical protein
MSCVTSPPRWHGHMRDDQVMTWPLGVIMVLRLVIRGCTSVAGTPERRGVPRADLSPGPERRPTLGHSTPRAGEWRLGHLPGGPFSATMKPACGDASESEARQDGSPRRPEEPRRVIGEGTETCLETVRRTKT